MAGLTSSERRTSPLALLLLAGGAVVSLRLLSQPQGFVGGPAVASRGQSFRGITRQAEEEGGGDDGGFLKFLKVEQDIELSPEEYKVALEQEIEAQRKRYYIGGEVKPNNLVVPWKPVDEKQLEQDARRQLKKNGIADPEGGAVSGSKDKNEDSLISIQVVGEEDVLVEWTAGEPGTKVGYIIERKRPQDANFMEIASYNSPSTPYLLVQSYAGHEYAYTDEIVKPGTYTYRVLCRYRSGEVQVTDQKDIEVPELDGVDNTVALIALVVVLGGALLGGYFADPTIK